MRFGHPPLSENHPVTGTPSVDDRLSTRIDFDFLRVAMLAPLPHETHYSDSVPQSRLTMPAAPSRWLLRGNSALAKDRVATVALSACDLSAEIKSRRLFFPLFTAWVIRLLESPPGKIKKAATPACAGMTASVNTVSRRTRRRTLKAAGATLLDFSLRTELHSFRRYFGAHWQPILNLELFDLSVPQIRAVTDQPQPRGMYGKTLPFFTPACSFAYHLTSIFRHTGDSILLVNIDLSGIRGRTHRLQVVAYQKKWESRDKGNTISKR